MDTNMKGSLMTCSLGLEASAAAPRRADRLARVTIAVLALAITLAAFAQPAHAQFRVESFQADSLNQDGTTNTQAGAHPYAAATDFSVNTVVHDTVYGPSYPIELPEEHIKDVVVDLPAGFIGDPTAVPTCSRLELALNGGLGRCPVDSQVGIITVKLSNGVFGPPLDYTTGVYNIAPQAGETADFGFSVNTVPTHIELSVNPENGYRVRAVIDNASAALPVAGTRLTLWGVPGDPSHDSVRGPGFRCDQNAGGDVSNPSTCDPPGGFAAGSGLRPLISNPTFCGPPATTSIRMTSWEHPDNWISADALSPSGTGCDSLTFAPTLTAQSSTAQAGAPTGLHVDLAMAQDGLSHPHGLATAHLRTVKVTLPEGMTINPASADGLVACSDAQLKLGSDDPLECPDGSKIGTATAATPVLKETLTGGIYLRSQASHDPESGDMFRIALVLRDAERGISVRLPGSVAADKDTGRLTATFADNPQLPVSDLDVRFKGGARAPLTTSDSCGTFNTESQLIAWSGQVVNTLSPMTIDQRCGTENDFAPALDAGVANPQAGASSAFSLTLTRPDGQQDVSGLDVTLPPGVLGHVGSVPRCPDAQATDGTCSSASQIGKVVIAAGAGPSPLSVPQAGKALTAVYLAGPYRGAPFSLSIVVPAQAGPFDLGTVVVRAALFVDPIDAHVTVISDPIPTILDGVPLNVQKIDVTIDRPGFMVAPTKCDEMAVGADVRAATGAVARVSNRFQVADCANLALRPGLDLTLSGKNQTTDGKHPAVSATLAQKPGQANLKKVRVALPLSLALDPDNANGLCEFVDGSKVEPTCPKASIVGTATAVTPILDQPLSGPVYFVKNIRKDPKSGREIRTLPKLVIPLVGQNGVKLTLTGTSAVVDDQLVTTFDNIPDAPVSSFKLNIIGGKGGILTVSGADICKATQIADQQIDGQNNKAADADVYIQTPSCPTKIISKTVGKTTVKLKIGGLGAGKVTVTGRGIRKTTRTISKSTVATVTAKRTGKSTPGAFKVKFTKAKAAVA
jgi:hypothetical protein